MDSAHNTSISPDEIFGGWVLEIDGAVQSHVDLENPRIVRFEYVLRITALIEGLWARAQPLTSLHLGAGALTLSRYLQATRPGSVQTVVEIEPGLIAWVIDRLPLPEGIDLRILEADAGQAVAGLARRPEHGTEGFDLIVLDIDTGHPEAQHLATPEFMAEVQRLLSSHGVLIVNVGDELGLRHVVAQARLLEAVGGVWMLADATLLAERTAGNVVLATGPGVTHEMAKKNTTHKTASAAHALQEKLRATGPHPAAVLRPDETRAWLRSD